jgi:putative ABC transport system substrate-binding protein
MRRREFITLLGAAAAWPLAARAQQAEQMRRIGALMTLAADDPQAQVRLAAFQQALQQLGWSDGRNCSRGYAQELITRAPDIFLASATVSVAALPPLATSAWETRRSALGLHTELAQSQQ